MKKISFIILSILFYVFLTSCTKTLDRKTEIIDVKKEETLILRKKPSQEYIVGIKIHISGTVKGQAVISIIYANKVYRTNKLNGDFSFNWNGEWYDDIVIIRYQPIDVQSGNITIHYEFE